ncbi:MAG: transcriptional repressor LexA [Acetobacteraceae bacterium]
MLTRKQRELLLFIDRRLHETGVAPSFEEMRDGVGLRSKSGIHRLVLSLEERGFIRRYRHRARALDVLRLPDDQVAQPGAEAVADRGFAPTVIRGDFSPRLAGARPALHAAAMQIPLYGRIAAGLPIEALRDPATYIDVPTTQLAAGEHYALEVAGDSMIEAGILDGDTVVIRREDTAENGQIVVALIDDAEVTLKRLRRRGNSIALEPANPKHETRIFPAERVKIQGRLAMLFRRY